LDEGWQRAITGKRWFNNGAAPRVAHVQLPSAYVYTWH